MILFKNVKKVIDVFYLIRLLFINFHLIFHLKFVGEDEMNTRIRKQMVMTHSRSATIRNIVPIRKTFEILKLKTKKEITNVEWFLFIKWNGRDHQIKCDRKFSSNFYFLDYLKSIAFPFSHTLVCYLSEYFRI